MQEILDFLQSLDWSPLVISIKTGIVATILSFFFGIFAARAVMKLRPGARAVIEFLKSNMCNKFCDDMPEIYFAGNNISALAIKELVDICSCIH